MWFRRCVFGVWLVRFDGFGFVASHLFRTRAREAALASVQLGLQRLSVRTCWQLADKLTASLGIRQPNALITLVPSSPMNKDAS